MDVVVVGLGSMGSAAAYHCAQRGLKVLGLDRFVPPHDRGAHSGGSRILRMAYMEGADYVPLVRRSYDLWRELEAAAGRPLLLTTGALMLGRPEAVAVAGALASAQAHDVPHSMLTAAQVRKRFPAFAPADDEVGLFEDNAGLLLPDRAISAYLRLAVGLGAQIRTDSVVTGWEATSSGVQIATRDDTITAERLVLAPGAWAPQLTGITVPMRVERRVQHYWEPADPKLYARGRFPVWIWEYTEGEAAYGLPAMAGLVKAAMHHGSELVDPDADAAPAREDEIADVRAWLKKWLPGLGKADLAESIPCLYTLTPDRHFVLGPHPEHPNVALACGFSGHGFKFAPVVGEILADLVQHGCTQHPIALFDPARLT